MMDRQTQTIPDHVRDWTSDVSLAVSLLTRVPVRHPDDAMSDRMSRAQRAFPLVGAMIVSFTLVPVMCFFALRKHGAVRTSPVLKLARKVHDPILRSAMANPLAVLTLCACLVIAHLCHWLLRFK